MPQKNSLFFFLYNYETRIDVGTEDGIIKDEYDIPGNTYIYIYIENHRFPWASQFQVIDMAFLEFYSITWPFISVLIFDTTLRVNWLKVNFTC